MTRGIRKWIKWQYDRWTHGGVTCLEAEEFLLDYVEGTLDSRRRRIFDAHLAACPLCVAYLLDYKHAVELAKSAARLEPNVGTPPPDLVNAIVKAVASASSS